MNLLAVAGRAAFVVKAKRQRHTAVRGVSYARAPTEEDLILTDDAADVESCAQAPGIDVGGQTGPHWGDDRAQVGHQVVVGKNVLVAAGIHCSDSGELSDLDVNPPRASLCDINQLPQHYAPRQDGHHGGNEGVEPL